MTARVFIAWMAAARKQHAGEPLSEYELGLLKMHGDPLPQPLDPDPGDCGDGFDFPIFNPTLVRKAPPSS